MRTLTDHEFALLDDLNAGVVMSREDIGEFLRRRRVPDDPDLVTAHLVRSKLVRRSGAAGDEKWTGTDLLRRRLEVLHHVTTMDRDTRAVSQSAGIPRRLVYADLRWWEQHGFVASGRRRSERVLYFCAYHAFEIRPRRLRRFIVISEATYPFHRDEPCSFGRFRPWVRGWWLTSRALAIPI